VKLDQKYRTPEGFYDQPYVYVYDGDALTDGNNYSNVPAVVPRDGAAFVLRQIYGRNNLCARVQIKDDYAPFTGASAGVVLPNTYPIIPERVIQPEGILGLDLFTVARANRVNLAVTIFFAQMAFQGVRRWPLSGSAPGATAYPGPSSYKYWEKGFSYGDQAATQFTVNWAGTDTLPRKFIVPVDEMDFELQRVTLMRLQRAGVNNFGVPANEIKLMLYDTYPRPLMSAPVLDVILNDAADATTHPYNGTFPVPGVLYRRGSVIQFEVTSLLTVNMLNSVYQIVFQGVRRVPCR
jgi:hypothetical protein